MQSLGYTDGFEARADHSTSHRDGDTRVRIGRLASLSYNLFELNRAFLRLLIDADAPLFGEPGSSLLDAVIRPLKRLTTTEIAAIADCPYTLFDLRFDDTQLWSRVIASAFEVDAAPPLDSKAVDLVRSILYFVWYATRTDDTFTRCALGMTPPVAAQFAELSVFNVTKIIPSACGFVSPRWPRHPLFWPDLTRFSSMHAPIQLHASKLLGCQLLAASSMKNGTTRKITTRTT